MFLLTTNNLRINLTVLIAVLLGALFFSPAYAQDIGLNNIEKEIWDDPDFQRRFAESYLSETEIEPSVSNEERALLVKLLEIIKPDDSEAELEAAIEKVNNDANFDDQQKQNKIKDLRDKAEEDRDTRQAYREELEINMDLDGDGTPEGAFEVALYEISQYKQSLENVEAMGAMIHFFAANFHMQTGLKLEAPEGSSEEEVAAVKAQAQEQLRLAAENYEVATVRHPKFRRAYRNLGLLQVRMRDFDGARISFAKVVELGGGDSDTYGLLGYCFSQLKLFLPAESAYRMANLLDPDERNWQMGLVSSFFFQKRYGDVVALTGDMIKQEPGNPELWLLQANAFIGLNDAMKAAENYEIVDSLGASTPQSLSMLANIYTNQGLHQAAVDAYLKSLDMVKGTDKADALVDQMLRGAKVLASQSAMGPTKNLIAGVEKAVGKAMDGEDRKQWLKLKARIAVQEGASGEEVETLKQVVALDPLDGEAIILLGQNAAREKDVDLAINYFQRAAQIEKYEADAKLWWARVLAKERRYNEALPLLRAVMQIKPSESVQRFITDLEKVSSSG